MGAAIQASITRFIGLGGAAPIILHRKNNADRSPTSTQPPFVYSKNTANDVNISEQYVCYRGDRKCHSGFLRHFGLKQDDLKQ